MHRRLQQAIRRYFTSPLTYRHAPTKFDDGPPATNLRWPNGEPVKELTLEQKIMVKDQEIAIARMEQDREVANNMILSQHRLLIMTTIATFVGLISSATALIIAANPKHTPPPVIQVEPSKAQAPVVNVHVPEVKPMAEQ